MVVSEFKAKCIAVLKEAQRTHEPIMITLRGHPIARIEPVFDDPPPRRLGAFRGQVVIREELVGQDFDADWEIAR